LRALSRPVVDATDLTPFEVSVAKAAKRSDKKAEESTETTSSGATVGYEAKLRQMVDALRGSMDAAEYKRGGPTTWRLPFDRPTPARVPKPPRLRPDFRPVSADKT
jgi:hypothetical protein